MEFSQSDPWVEEQIDEVASPFQQWLSPDDFIWLKRQLFELLHEDGRAAALLKAARPRYVDESGEVGGAAPPNGIKSHSKAG